MGRNTKNKTRVGKEYEMESEWKLWFIQNIKMTNDSLDINFFLTSSV